MSLTQRLAELIVSSAPSPQAREQARGGLLDFVSVALPIVQGDIADTPLTQLRAVYRNQDAQTRALLLGYAGHALDFDDFHPDFRGHPTTVILPALFALMPEKPDISGDAFLDAYVIGVEVAGRLGLAAGPQHYKAGHHSTATLGTLAAAAASARLLNANVAQTANILGIATTRASGLRAQFGSAVKPLHAGFAAESAVIATRLAFAGLQGQADKVLDAFLTSGGGGQESPEKLVAGWGLPGASSRRDWSSSLIRPVRAPTALPMRPLRCGPNGCKKADRWIRSSPTLCVLKWPSRPVVILRPRFAYRTAVLRPVSVWNM